MRTYLLIFATMGLLGAAFFFYWHAQPAILIQPDLVTHRAEPPPPTTQGTAGTQIRPGSRIWAVMYDDKGNISSRYRAQEYLPQKDGTVHLIKPEADFYLGNRQRLHVTGEDGDVVMRTTPKISLDTTSAQPMGPPSRGRLHTVNMTLFDDVAPDAPVSGMTMTTDNIDFDNDSFLITTGGFTAPNGKMIAADQVPVQVRGEYEFDGRGLTLRWNDRDDRLELLEIAHGEKLTILHPSNRNGPGNGIKTTAAAVTAPASAPQPDVASAGNVGTPVRNSNDTPTPPTTPHAPTTAPKPGKGPKPTYVATFQEAVRITQGDQSLITADTMRLHFRLKEQAAGATTQPAGSSRDQGMGSAKGQAAADATSAAAATPGVPRPEPVAVTTPVPAPVAPVASTDHAVAGDIPVVVRWTGKLRIVPETTSPRPVGQGDAIMELIGKTSPVQVYRAAVGDSPASEVRCATLLYMTADGGAFLSGSEQFGQVQVKRHALPSVDDEDTPPPSVVTADTLDYGGSRRITTLGHNGEAVIPIAGNPGEQPAILDAKWKERAEFEFFPRGGDEMAIRSARFFGDVEVRHPQLDLDSQRLTLLFAAPRSSPAGAKVSAGAQSALTEMQATDRVHCRMVDTAGKQQTVDAASLDMHTARSSDGKFYARQIDATGDAQTRVHAFDGSQDLFCDVVRLMLRPAHGAPQPDAKTAGGVDTSSVELERLDARGNVKVAAKDGSATRSDDLLVAMNTDGPHVMFTGDTLSKVWDAKKNVLSGLTIVMEPRQQLAHVIGPGKLHEVAEPASAGKPATRQMDVIWSDGADLDGIGNQIMIRGNVVATMPDSDGTINTAHADRIRIDLIPKPAPATQASAVLHASSTTKPTNDMDLLRDKEPGAITLTDEQGSIVESDLSDANGILRQFQLKAPRIIYAVAATSDVPAHTLLVPSAGTMLVRDHRPPPVGAEKNADQGGLGTGRGATAFKWTRQLIYNEDTRRAVMSGDVMVVHQSDDAGEPAVQLNADEMTATFQPAGKKPLAKQPGDAAQPMDLKNMEADGNVLVNRGPMQINAQRLYFDPGSHWMTFQGNARNPVSVTDEKGTQSGDEVKWNTDTWDFAIKGAEGAGR